MFWHEPKRAKRLLVLGVPVIMQTRIRGLQPLRNAVRKCRGPNERAYLLQTTRIRQFVSPPQSTARNQSAVVGDLVLKLAEMAKTWIIIACYMLDP